MTKGVAEVANLFMAPAAHGFNFAAEVYPGYPGLVICAGELRTMAWGFPRHDVSKKTGRPLKPKPVNNARNDRLWVLPMWKESFRERRCLIPVTAWAEAEGEKGRMTRTWYSLHGHELFAVGGIWRTTEEWGDAYSMVMVDGCEHMSEVHDRMPVLLHPDQWAQWTDGSAEEAFKLVQTCPHPLQVDRSSEPWFKVRAAAP